jgi:hypothetical protein
MNSTVIIGYGWHHISVIILHEAVELYRHKLNTLNRVTWKICRGYILQFKWRIITEMWCQPYPIITVLFISMFIQTDGCDSNILILLHFYTIVTVVFVSLLNYTTTLRTPISSETKSMVILLFSECGNLP